MRTQDAIYLHAVGAGVCLKLLPEAREAALRAVSDSAVFEFRALRAYHFYPTRNRPSLKTQRIY